MCSTWSSSEVAVASSTDTSNTPAHICTTSRIVEAATWHMVIMHAFKYDGPTASISVTGKSVDGEFPFYSTMYHVGLFTPVFS